jgi:type II secretory pathway component PulF
MKCSNSASHVQGSRVIIIVVQVGVVKIYVAAMEALGKRKDRMKLSLPPKFMGKLVWVAVISFCKTFIPSYTFDALLCQN